MHIEHKQQNTLPSFDYVQNFHTIDYFASKLVSAAIYKNCQQFHAYLVRKYISILQVIDATNYSFILKETYIHSMMWMLSNFEIIYFNTKNSHT